MQGSSLGMDTEFLPKQQKEPTLKSTMLNPAKGTEN